MRFNINFVIYFIRPGLYKNKFVMKSSHIKTKQYWKEKVKSQMQRKMFKKQIFGDHYNFQSVRINNNKKYFNEEVKIMEIERSNRFLLEKIKRISQRSKPRTILQRARTQVLDNQTDFRRSSTESRLDRNQQIAEKKHRYQSVQTFLKKTAVKYSQKHQDNNSQNHQQQNQSIMLFRGKRSLQGIYFSFSIYIQKGVYTIFSQTRKSQQKIQIPLENYKFLLKQELDNQHENIFKLLRLCEDNKLELKGSKKFQVDIIEKSEIQLPLINKKRGESCGS